MNAEQIIEKLTEIVGGVVNCIANNEYEKTEIFAKVGKYGLDDNKGQAEALNDIKEGIEMNYIPWAEDIGKALVIDSFNKDNMHDDFEDVAEDLLEDGRGFITYNLTWCNSQLDYFFLEFKIVLTENDRLDSTFTMNV